MSDDERVELEQPTKVFKALGSEVRLKLLREATEAEYITAPELADDFEITAESVKRNLDQLADAGLLEVSRERGAGNRPRDEFRLAHGGVTVNLDAVPDDLSFYIGEADVATEF